MNETTEERAKILIVDDELGMREGCRRVLSSLRHDVETVDSVTGARAAIERTAYDLALIDVMMPDGSGLDLCVPIHEKDPDAICIVITGYATIEMAVDAVKRGAYDFLPKPFTSDQLIVAVNQGLERRRLRREAAQVESYRRQNDDLLQAKAELEKLERMKSQFMLSVAHELRAPAAAMQSYINLILSGYVSEDELRPIMRRTQLRLQELLDLIADLLELAHLKQAGAAPAVAKSPQEVADILSEVVDLMREQARQKGLDLQVDIVDRPIISATHNHMRQIWTNLISNAIKYTPAGGRVTVRLEANEASLMGSVEDTGMGIAEEDLACLFQEFFRTNQAKASGEIGTGLGLAIMKQIIDSYHGTITVQSRPGQGSRFAFTLPLREKPAEARPVPVGTHTRVLGLADEPWPGDRG